MIICSTFFAFATLGPLYRISKEKLTARYLSWLINKEFAGRNPGIEDTIEDVLLKLFQGGILDYFRSSNYFTLELAHIKNMQFESDEAKPLTFDHMQQMIILASIGWMISIFAFFYELFIKKAK